MNIKINGEQKEYSDNVTLSVIIKDYLNGKNTEGIAIALNSEIVFKQNWDKTKLKNNDEVEIVHAVQGG